MNKINVINVHGPEPVVKSHRIPSVDLFFYSLGTFECNYSTNPTSTPSLSYLCSYIYT